MSKFLLFLTAAAALTLAAVYVSITDDTHECKDTKDEKKPEKEKPESKSDEDLVDELGLNSNAKDAKDITAKANASVYSALDFTDTHEAEFAKKGKIDAPEKLELKDDNEQVIWSQKAYDFLDNCSKCPDTVNPSLWENTKNNHEYGLFEVIDGIYQVRGYDMANLTLVKGDTGWIIFDPLMSIECTKAAMELVKKNLGSWPVRAVIISHPHIDHYGGIKGLMSDEDAADPSLPIEEQTQDDKIPVIVPYGFAEHAVSENVYVGQAMGRRATYQYGVYLDPSETSKMSIGIGMGQSVGSVSYINPTYEITYTGEPITIDGVKMEFQMTPGTEAPAEMNTWFPQKKALWVAENCTCTLHNLYTLRGAQVRDGSEWAKYICEAITRYGDDVEVTFQSHNWPHWGNQTIHEYLVNTAAVYKYINDQTLTYINKGYTTDEISNMIKLPAELAKNWYTRQYYGTVAHNSKAVYQKYMGWYDANPVHLNPLTPEESAKRWASYMNIVGIDNVIRQAKKDFDKGDYQWVAEVTNKIVFSDPENQAARLLCADALEQLGYQAESGTWRNVYLTGAKELRSGNASGTVKQASSGTDMQKNMTAEMMFDYMGILMNKEMLAIYDDSINIILTDTEENFCLRFKNGVLLVFKDHLDKNAESTIKTEKNALFYMLTDNYEELQKASRIMGDTKWIRIVMASFNQFDPGKPADFNIIEP